MGWFAVASSLAVVGGIIVFVVGACMRRRRRVGWRVVNVEVLLWVWCWGVTAMTFGTRSGGGSSMNFAPLDMTNAVDVADFGLNMLMFVPAGALLAVYPVRWLFALLGGVSVSAGIEVLQFLLATGRTADVNDLGANALGCLWGFWAGALVVWWIGRLRVRHTALE